MVTVERMTSPQFLLELRHGLSKCSVRGGRVIVAVSGGADSVALLLGLCELREEFGIELVVAHLNHALRGDESDADAEWVGQLAEQLGLQVESDQIPESAWAATGGGMEEAARALRYRFLDDVATKHNATMIAVAHTADDQAETVLHNLARGTGISGIRGMQRVRPTTAGHGLIRPMLGIRRATLEAFLADRGQPFRNDSTNIDVKITRNRIRHQVMPMLREQLNSHIDAALCRFAEQAAEIDEVLDIAAETILPHCIQHTHLDSCHLDVSPLRDKPRHLVRHIFRAIWRKLNWPMKSMGFDEWNRLADLLISKKTITLPDRIEARFRSDTLLILRRLQLTSSQTPPDSGGAVISPPPPTHSEPPATSSVPHASQ